jgi:DUF971 family protein
VSSLPTPRLIKIEPNLPRAAVHLEWSDGTVIDLPYVDLRFACPCAACVDEHTGIRTLKRESIPSDIRITRVEPVGRYALSLTWSDGHATGMHSYDSLWELSRS